MTDITPVPEDSLAPKLPERLSLESTFGMSDYDGPNLPRNVYATALGDDIQVLFWPDHIIARLLPKLYC